MTTTTNPTDALRLTPARDAMSQGQPLDASGAMANAMIERAVARANSTRSVIADDTARLIAATIHEGEGTALQRFAVTGELDLPATFTEWWNLPAAPTGPVPPAWWIAMDRYLENQEGDLD